jgi:uncharacterized protein (DUF433 family)
VARNIGCDGYLLERKMTTLVNIGQLISDDLVRPCIAGTRVSVQQIAVLTQEGLSPAEIADEYPQISLAQVHAALTYYYANQSRIDEALAQEKLLYDKLASA